MNKQVIYTIMTRWSEQTQLSAILIPHRASRRILSFPQPSQSEKPFRSGAPRSNGFLPFRLCVGVNGHSPQESKWSPWQEFVLPPVHTSAFHSLLCHWVYLRLQRSKIGKELLQEILIFWGKFLGVFVLILESRKALSQTTRKPLNSPRS